MLGKSDETAVFKIQEPKMEKKEALLVFFLSILLVPIRYHILL